MSALNVTKWLHFLENHLKLTLTGKFCKTNKGNIGLHVLQGLGYMMQTEIPKFEYTRFLKDQDHFAWNRPKKIFNSSCQSELSSTKLRIRVYMYSIWYTTIYMYNTAISRRFDYELCRHFICCYGNSSHHWLLLNFNEFHESEYGQVA